VREFGGDVLHLEDRLDRPLSMGGTVADDDRPPIVLKRTRHDLGGRGAKTVHQDRHRPVVGKVLGLVAVDLDVARIVLHLDHRALVDKQPRELDGLAEEAASVVSKVKDKPLDARLLQVHDELCGVLACAGLVGIGVAVVGGPVEGGQRDDAEGNEGAVRARDLEHRGAGARRIQFDDVARDDDFLADGRIGRVAGLNDKVHPGSLGAPNLVHDLAQLHADNLDRLLPVLGNLDDLVVGLELAIEVGWPARHDLLHDARVILKAEHRADADELELHLDSKVLVRIR